MAAPTGRRAIAYRINRQALMARGRTQNDERRVEKKERRQIEDMNTTVKEIQNSDNLEDATQIFAMLADTRLTPDLGQAIDSPLDTYA